METIAREMAEYKVEILVLLVTKWMGNEEIHKEEYTLYYSRENTQSRNGSAFIIHKQFREAVIKFKPVNGRIYMYHV